MRLLIVSLDSYSLFDTSTDFIFGGAELRASIFAKELARIKDMEVIVVTRDHSRKNKKFGDVLVVQHPFKKGAGYWNNQKKVSTRIKNKIFKKETSQSVFSFFSGLGPTHALVLGMGPEAVECRDYCCTANIPFIFGCASEADLDEKFLIKDLVFDSSGNDASKYAGVIRSAALVLVQSQQQNRLLKKRFGREGFILPNPISPEPLAERLNLLTTSEVLWVGKTSSLKRPELLIELARMLPNLNFRMIINNTNDQEWKRLMEDKPANIEVIESVPAAHIESYFKKTRLLVNTSSVEGFPNTFLQAGKYGVPIVSTNADPNNILSEKKTGILSGDALPAIKESVLKLLKDEVLYKTCSENISSYVKENHNTQQVIKQLYGAMKQIAENAA